MRIFSGSILLALTLLTWQVEAGKNYWWMNDPSVFSSGNGGSYQTSGSSQQNYQSQQNYNQESSYVETECPVGTKCVADHFCNEYGVMVNYRVSLTPEQKQQRGDLIPCVNPGNGGLYVCCSTANQAGSSVSFQSSDVISNTNQGFSGPISQQQQTLSIPSGECPNISVLPPVGSCEGKVSDCWSVGQPDVDCPGNALCCFDGCVNACYFGGSSRATSTSSFSSSAPSQSFAPAPAPAPVRAPAPSTSFQSSSSVTTFQESFPAVTFEEPAAPSSSYTPETVFVPDQGGYDEPNPPAFQTPSPPRTTHTQTSFSSSQQSFKPPRKHSYSTGSSQTQATFVPPRRQQQQQNFAPSQQQQTTFQSSNNFQASDTKPFVKCPAAMKCVPRVNCDFNGVMTDQVLNLTPDLEMLRVPLIPCVNPETTNIDVCCRDPNYTDPWPMDSNGNFIDTGATFNNNNNIQAGGNGIKPRVQGGGQHSGYGK